MTSKINLEGQVEMGTTRRTSSHLAAAQSLLDARTCVPARRCVRSARLAAGPRGEAASGRREPQREYLRDSVDQHSFFFHLPSSAGRWHGVLQVQLSRS